MARFKPVPLPIVDGAMRGPDGLALSPFARFAERFQQRRSLDAPGEELVTVKLPQADAVSSNGAATATSAVLSASGALLALVEGKNDRD